MPNRRLTSILSLLIVVPLVGSVITYVAGARDQRGAVVATLAVAGLTLGLAFYAFVFTFANVPGPGQYALVEQYPWFSVANFGVDFYFGLDGLSSPLVLATALLTLLVVFGARSMVLRNQPAFLALILFFEGSIMGVFTSLNLIVFYVFWELVMIPMFILIGFWGGERRRYASMKFLIYIFAGSTVMLLAFLAVYLSAGRPSFDITALSGSVPTTSQYLPLLATFIGFGIKLPSVPLHDWLPDAYTQAPAPVAALLAGAQSAMGGYGLIRISIGLFPQASHSWGWIFMGLGLLTMFYGAVVALRATTLRRMFSYTSLNHMGFVLFGSFATVESGSPIGMEGAILQMFVHAFTAGSLFMVSGYVIQRAGTDEISQLRGMRDTMPRLAGLLVLASAGAMALPPFASFLGELTVIAGAITANPYNAVAIIVPVLTGGYLLWMIRRVVLTPRTEGATRGQDIPWADAVDLALYIVPLVVLIFASYLVLSPAAPVAGWIVRLLGGT